MPKKRKFTWAASGEEEYFYSDGSQVSASPGYHTHISTRYRRGDAEALQFDDLPELYSSRAECCGCTACVFACPVGAITMEPDEEGFNYPVVTISSCIHCKKCLAACAFKAR